MNEKQEIVKHSLGIEGVSFGSAGIWTLVFFALVAALRQWIVGIADRKRADNEGMSLKEAAEITAHQLLFEQMQRQMARMEAEIVSLKGRVMVLEETERKHLLEIAILKGATS